MWKIHLVVGGGTQTDDLSIMNLPYDHYTRVPPIVAYEEMTAYYKFADWTMLNFAVARP